MSNLTSGRFYNPAPAIAIFELDFYQSGAAIMGQGRNRFYNLVSLVFVILSLIAVLFVVVRLLSPV
jgi:hypothetical protein